MILVRNRNTYFFKNCALYIDNRYVGSGAGSGDGRFSVLTCCSGDKCLRLVEDGYVYLNGDVVEVGLLRDYGYAEVRSFEDGTLYIYRGNVNGNGVFSGAVYDEQRSVHVTAIAGSMLVLLEYLESGQP